MPLQGEHVLLSGYPNISALSSLQMQQVALVYQALIKGILPLQGTGLRSSPNMICLGLEPLP